jgi:hypothetical protein
MVASSMRELTIQYYRCTVVCRHDKIADAKSFLSNLPQLHPGISKLLPMFKILLLDFLCARLLYCCYFCLRHDADGDFQRDVSNALSIFFASRDAMNLP